MLEQVNQNDPVTDRCNLYISEKYLIICKTLNERNELISTCRHANNFTLRNFVTQHFNYEVF